MRKVIVDIGQLVTYSSSDEGMVIREGVDLAIEDGRVVEIGKDLYTPEAELHSAEGRLVTPAFVDPHTHPVFATTRELEFEMRSEGKSYQEIARAGGGIRNSVRRFRQTPDDILSALTERRIRKFIPYGTLTIEAKSGYGLSVKDEIRSLEILRNLSSSLHIRIIATFLGAHEIPDEYQNKREAYLELVIDEMIPEVANRKLARYCDVFCEEGVFTAEETGRILQAARKHGLKGRVHVDEFKPIGGIEVAIENKAVSVDHLTAITDESIELLRGTEVIPVVLPGTTFFLGSTHFAPARKMWDAGLKVALATDYNPGSSYLQSMQLVLTIACVYLKLTPLEALQASTYHAALSLEIAHETGALEPGKEADFIIWNYDNYRLIPYSAGDNGVAKVFKEGNLLLAH